MTDGDIFLIIKDGRAISNTMPNWSIRHGIASAQHLLQVAGKHGASISRCLEGSGISEVAIADAETEITPEQELRLIRNVLAALPHVPGLALEVGARYHLTDFGIWGYALISCRTLGDAMRLALGYLDLSFIFGDLQFVEIDADVAALRFNYEMIPADIRQFLIERDAAAINAVERLVAPNTMYPVLRMNCSYPRPAHAALYKLALGVEPVFDAPVTEVQVSRKLLEMPLPGANEATARMCEAECKKLLARRVARAGVSARVRDVILRQPAQSTDMDAIAAGLCMTSRTLRRHLAEEGVTFRTLREEVLLMLAEELMGTAHIKLAEVAERLGYSDAAAFSHAYKRWKGVTPGASRHA